MGRPEPEPWANHRRDLRDSAADERDAVADQRDLDADERDLDADERERAADERERAADERDRAADEREHDADVRDRIADKRDRVADRRERDADAREGEQDARQLRQDEHDSDPTPAHGHLYVLSDRERAILELIVAGASNEEVAARLFLSPNTVKGYIRSAYAKAAVTTRAQAVTWYLTGEAPTSTDSP